MNRTYLLTIAAAALLACIALVATKIEFRFNTATEGLFVLEGEGEYWLELNDDLVPEDAARLIWAMPRYPFRKIVQSSKCDNSSGPCLDFKWNKERGRGFVRNTWPDGSKLVINIGRFKDSKKNYPSGIFIGGGLPPSDPDYRYMNNEATGMTYFDGRRWYHIWCNANEGLVAPDSPFLASYPSEWEYRGSRVWDNNGRDITIESRHRVIFTGVPLDVTRLLFYTAGDSYVILSTEFTNRGSAPFHFQYMYGDEPWIGDFGSSAGDVGWMDQELILAEREVDTKLHTYFGMFDYGNRLAGEIQSFTGIANFIEWDRDERPDKAYISNIGRGVDNPGRIVPLAHPNNRFIGLQYGPLMLKPGESFHFTIAIGLAERDPKTGFPRKPKTELNP